MLRNKSVAIKMLVSYLLILVIPVIAMVGGYCYIEKVFENEVINSNQLVLSMLRGELDKLFEAQKSNSVKLIFSNSINRMLSPGLDFKARWELEQQIQSELQSMQLSNSSLDNIYVYFCNQDIAITSSAVTSGKTLYQMYYDWGKDGYEKWRKFILGELGEPFYILDNCIGMGKTGRTVTVINTLPLNDRFRKYAVLAVTVQMNKIEKIIEQVGNGNNIDIAILDAENKDILGKSKYNFSEIELGKKSGIHKDVFFSVQDSNVTPWKYVLTIDKKVMRRQIMYIRVLMLLCLLATLIVGLYLSRKFTKINYKPIEEIMSVLTKGHLRESNKENEYSYIFKVLEQNQLEQDKIEKMYEHQRKEFRVQLFSLLMSGQVKDMEKVKQSLGKLEVSFHTDQFAAVLIYFEDYKKLFSDEKDLSDSKRSEMYKLIVTNIVEELLNRNYLCCVFEKDLYMAVLVNMKNESNENTSAEIAEIMKQAVAFIRENFSISLCAAVSNVHQSLEKLAECYFEANDTIIQMRASGEYGVRCYCETDSSIYNWKEQMHKEEELLNLMRVGDSEKAKLVLNNLFSAGTGDSRRNQKILCGFLYHLASVICNEAAERMDINARQWCAAAIQKLICCTTESDIKEQMSLLIDFVCDYTGKNKETERMSEKIKQYVLQNYTKPDFNVNAVGEHFGVTPTYISRIFKSECGEMLGNYITELRVEHAKRLIAQTDRSLTDIAREVGYLDSKALARAFKKRMGILPSQYKNFSNGQKWS